MLFPRLLGSSQLGGLCAYFQCHLEELPQSLWTFFLLLLCVCPNVWHQKKHISVVLTSCIVVNYGKVICNIILEALQGEDTELCLLDAHTKGKDKAVCCISKSHSFLSLSSHFLPVSPSKYTKTEALLSSILCWGITPVGYRCWHVQLCICSFGSRLVEYVKSWRQKGLDLSIMSCSLSCCLCSALSCLGFDFATFAMGWVF